MKCPNKNLPEWKALDKAMPDLSHYLWNKHDGNLPPDLIDKITTDEVVDPTTGEVTKTLPVPIEAKADKETLQNEYIDIHLKVLTHPEVLTKVLSPLDKSGTYSLASEADVLHDLRTKDKPLPSPLSQLYQQKSFIQNRAGKMGVAVLSLTSTFNATIQDMDLIAGITLRGKFIPNVIKFEGIELSRLSGVGTNERGSKADNIADVQNAAVDNANEQRLDKLNLNSHTFAAAGALMQLEDANGKNLDMQYISRLTAQQIIIDYVQEVESLDDSTIEEFVADKKEEAFARVTEKYENMISSDADMVIKQTSEASKLSPELMLKMIKDEGNPTPGWAALQLEALRVFNLLTLIQK